MKKGIRNITLITCCIDISHFSVRLYMVVWALQFSVSNALSANTLGSSSRMSNIYIYNYIYKYIYIIIYTTIYIYILSWGI